MPSDEIPLPSPGDLKELVRCVDARDATGLRSWIAHHPGSAMHKHEFAVRLAFSRVAHEFIETQPGYTDQSQPLDEGFRRLFDVCFQEGADADTLLSGANPYPQSLLYRAVGNAPLVAYLLEKGAGVEMRETSADFASSPLAVAAFSGYLDSAKLLVQAGANMDMVNSAYEPAIFLAFNGNQREVFEFFITQGADINAVDMNDFNILHQCALSKEDDMPAQDMRQWIRRFLELGADPAQETCKNETPLEVAQSYGAEHLSIMEEEFAAYWANENAQTLDDTTLPAPSSPRSVRM